jgi:hypothetical protein
MGDQPKTLAALGNDDEVAATHDAAGHGSAAGWLHSGDIGRISTWDGSLVITGRIKELLVTPSGENVAPAPVERAGGALNIPIAASFVTRISTPYSTFVNRSANLQPHLQPLFPPFIISTSNLVHIQTFDLYFNLKPRT